MVKDRTEIGEAEGVGVIKEDSIFERFYYSFSVFFLSKRALYAWLFLIINLLGLFCKNKYAKSLSVHSFLYLIIGFIIFANDTMMSRHLFGYFFLLSVFVLMFLLTSVSSQKIKYYILTFFVIFGGLNLSLTLYNNIKRNDKNNLLLEKELRKIIHKDAFVGGALNFWFFVPHSDFISYYNRRGISVDDCEYIIIDQIDSDFYNKYNERNEDYSVVYEQNTKHYGMVKVLKKNNFNILR